MIRSFRRQSKFSRAGFSLLELAVLLGIVGLTAATILEAYRTYARQKAANDTAVAARVVDTALGKFQYNYARLPRPAEPALAYTNINAGKEVASATAAALASGACTPNSLCKVDGARDTTDDADILPDPVLVGVLPYIALGLAPTDVQDGWGNMLTYAVSYYLTNAGTGGVNTASYNDQYGVINVKQLRNGHTGTESIDPVKRTDVLTAGLPTNSAYDFAVVSHGPDGKGAWNYFGKRPKACAGTARDVENCNGDSVFITPGQGSYDTNIISLASGTPAANALYFDDPFLLVELSRDSDKWSIASGGGVRNIYNKTVSNVGIGTATPVVALDVNGDVKANNFWANSLCDSITGNCFAPTIFGGGSGLGLDCNGGIMTGIQSGKAVCTQTINKALIATSSCPSGKYVTGINSAGVVTCGP